MPCHNLRISAVLDRPLFFRNLSVNNQNAHTWVYDSYVYISRAFTIMPPGRTAVSKPAIWSMYLLILPFDLHPPSSKSNRSCSGISPTTFESIDVVEIGRIEQSDTSIPSKIQRNP